MTEYPNYTWLEVLHRARWLQCVNMLYYKAAYTFQERSQNSEKRLLAPSCLSVCLSSCPPETTRLPLEGFSWNTTFEDFSKIYQENSSFIKIWQEYRVLYVNTYIHLWQYFAQFSLVLKIFQRKVVEKIKAHILCSANFSRKLSRLWDNVEKYGRAGQATDENTAHALCMLDN
jgi:hypothetical protein